MPTTIIHSNHIGASLEQKLIALLGDNLRPCQGYYVINSAVSLSASQLQILCENYHVDINVLPESFDPKAIKLVITDMDSTLINIECIDEIADFLGIKAQVSVITESAMRGEIDFNASLERRVGLLKGLDSGVLTQVYDQRLKLNPGTQELIEGLHAHGIKIALVSGGFTFFTERLKQRLNLDFARANFLEIENHKLSGKIHGAIVNAKAKANFLAEICQQLGISTDQTIAIGDGANDLEMLRLSGLGVAYKAKSKVQEQANIALNYSGLDSVLHLLRLDER